MEQRMEWYKLHSKGTPASCGVSILFNKNLKIVILNVIEYEGRILNIKCKINDRTYAFTNIYAPNVDDPNFFMKVTDQHDDVDYLLEVISI